MVAEVICGALVAATLAISARQLRLAEDRLAEARELHAVAQETLARLRCIETRIPGRAVTPESPIDAAWRRWKGGE